MGGEGVRVTLQQAVEGGYSAGLGGTEGERGEGEAAEKEVF